MKLCMTIANCKIEFQRRACIRFQIRFSSSFFLNSLVISTNQLVTSIATQISMLLN